MEKRAKKQNMKLEACVKRREKVGVEVVLEDVKEELGDLWGSW
jgi:hypothetical protein